MLLPHVWKAICNRSSSLINCVLGSEGKRSLGRPRHRWEDNIRTDLQEIGWKGVDLDLWSSGQGHMAGSYETVMNLQVPRKVSNFMTSCGTISFSIELVFISMII